MKTADPLKEAASAHKEALAAREAMDAAAARRGAAIRAAMAAGHTAPELAKALGVKHPQRIHNMARQGMTHKTAAFERGTSGYQGGRKGYAAECETCGAVTFGGFPTKAAAIDALEHTEDA